MKKGTLYIISTPIGNLEDITLRALRVLKEVDLVAVEDTRRAKVLLQAHNISNDVTSYHSYNLEKKTEFLIETLLQGKDVGLISDSGTPAISDPGSVLISEAIRNDIPLTSIPGPAAFLDALVLSGKSAHKFVFEGFLSNKSGRRSKQLEELKQEKRTVIIYESPHRIIRFLEDFINIMGDREIVIARELTKKFEEVRREKASLQLEHFTKIKPRGEFVITF
ncbi:MAG: 16S rRNA (cytidine(1402)-2'-O)-methyltransferase [Candidatus Omnitrophota bacterium]